MSRGGYIRAYRQVEDNSVFRNAGESMAFIWLVMNAAWRETRVRYKGRVLNLERGQFSISVRDFAAKWGWSEVKCRRYLTRLSTDAMIVVSHDAGVNLITICNYDVYQPSQQEGDAAGDAATSTVPTQERRSTDAQNKEDKESKKDNITPLSPPRKKRTRIPESFPDAEALAWARNYFQQAGQGRINVELEAANFCDTSASKGWLQLDWLAKWRTWCRNSVKYAGGRVTDLSRDGPIDPEAARAKLEAERIACLQ